VNAQWLCPWEFRQEIAIKNAGSSTLTDYQVRLDIPYISDMNADFSDLRFTTDDGITLLDYWIEVSSTSSAVVWVKIPTLNSGSISDFYLYYGNASAPDAGNASNTFLFFDDFTTFVGWNTYGTGIISQDNTTFPGTNVLSKITQCDPNGGYKSIGTTLEEFRLITREIRLNEGGNGCALNRYGLEDAASNGYNVRRDADTNSATSDFGFERRTGASGGNYKRISLAQPRENWYRTELTKCATTSNNITATLYEDDRTIIGTVTDTDLTFNSVDRITIRGGRPYYMDFIAITQFACIEPNVGFGTTEPFVELDPNIIIGENSGNNSDDGKICDGDQAILKVSPQFSSYSWSNGATTNPITVTDEDKYTVTVTDEYNCTATAIVKIEVFDLPTAGTCNVIHDYCQEGIGCITLEASGGTAPYEFSWTPSVGTSTTNTIENSGDQVKIKNIPGGSNISISVTDANGCSAN